MQIRDLEEQIGVALFLRTPQMIKLTPEGKILFDQVKRAVTEVQIGLDQLSDAALTRRGYVRIACVPTLASTRLPNILATFSVRFPRSIVHVRELSTASILDLLRRQEVEFALAPSIPNMGEFQFEGVLEDPLYACVPPVFDEGRDSIALADLVNKPCILLSNTTAVRGTIDAVQAELGISLDVQYEVQQTTTAIALAATGLGVAIIPKIALSQANAPQFRVVPISDLSARREIGIITLRGYVPQNYSEQLISLIKINLAQI
jgi:DNA-binding transcriptional LysR family regulator